MPQVLFDFFNKTKTEWLKSFSDYFCISEGVIADYFDNVDPDELTPGELINDLKLNLKDKDSRFLSIVCRHITTSSEINKKSFLSRGILNLKRMLQEKSPLSDFILNYGLSINVDERNIKINNKSYPITSYDESCKFCFKGEKNLCNTKCETREKMDLLGLKLYKYGATVEFFINSKVEQMKNYPTIRWCPEILTTLESIVSNINGLDKPDGKMTKDWIDKNTKCYLLEFPTQLCNMETFAPIYYESAWYEINDCLEHCGYSYNDYCERLIPQNVFDNLIFVNWFICIYFYDTEKLGSLLPGLSVDPEEIKIEEFV